MHIQKVSNPPLFFPFPLLPKIFYIICISNSLAFTVPDEGYSFTVPDEGYSSNVPDEGYSSNVPDEGYSRNAWCALNLISTFLFIFFYISCKTTFFKILS